MAVPVGGMFGHTGHKGGNHNRVNMWTFSGTVGLGVAGALSVVAGAVDTPYMSVIKTAAKTGRYTVQLIDRAGQAVGGFKVFEAFTVAVLNAAADAAYTAGKGMGWSIRNKDAQAGTFQIQFFRTNGTTDFNDTELEDNCAFTFGFLAKKSSAP